MEVKRLAAGKAALAAALAGGLTGGLAAAPAAAAPKVAADIAPVHALVARVMQGVGEPALILPPGASPHGHAMRPSEAAALESADVVVWIGEALTPWLEDPIETLAEGARHLELLEVPGARLLEFRTGVTFEAHAHDDHAGHDHGHKHDDHAGHGHDDDKHDDHAGHAHDDAKHDDHAGHDHDDAKHDDHAGHDHGHKHDDHAGRGHGHDDDKHEDHAGHAHEGTDPHAWLDPANAALWLDAIAAALSAEDPANAGAYFANAAAGKAELEALSAEIAAKVAPLAGRPFVVFHDAYHYFEARFGVEAAGAVSLSDAAEPGPRRLAEIRDAIKDMDAACVFAEPQFPPRLAKTAIEGTGARLGELDPLGADLALGADLYPALIRGLADDLAACLAPQG